MRHKHVCERERTHEFDIKIEQRPAAFFTPLHSRESQEGVFIVSFTVSSSVLTVHVNWFYSDPEGLAKLKNPCILLILNANVWKSEVLIEKRRWTCEHGNENQDDAQSGHNIAFEKWETEIWILTHLKFTNFTEFFKKSACKHLRGRP